MLNFSAGIRHFVSTMRWREREREGERAIYTRRRVRFWKEPADGLGAAVREHAREGLSTLSDWSWGFKDGKDMMLLREDVLAL